MKTLLCSAFLLVTIANNVLDIHAISSLDDETYSTFLELLKGEFKRPIATKEHEAEICYRTLLAQTVAIYLFKEATYALMVSQFYGSQLYRK